MCEDVVRNCNGDRDFGCSGVCEKLISSKNAHKLTQRSDSGAHPNSEHAAGVTFRTTPHTSEAGHPSTRAAARGGTALGFPLTERIPEIRTRRWRYFPRHDTVGSGPRARIRQSPRARLAELEANSAAVTPMPHNNTNTHRSGSE